MPPNPPATYNYELTFHGGPAPTYTIPYSGPASKKEILNLIDEAWQADRLLLFDDCAIAVREFHYITVKELPS